MTEEQPTEQKDQPQPPDPQSEYEQQYLEQQQFQPQRVQQQFSDSHYAFNRFIVDPKAEQLFDYITRDIKLSKLNSQQQTIALEILRRIGRLKQIGDYKEFLYEEKYFESQKDGKLHKKVTPVLDENKKHKFEIQNKFPRALNIYMNDLFSLTNVASAADGFEREMLVSQLTNQTQHYIEQTEKKQEHKWFNLFPGKKNQ